jgi:hypothetical protein
MRPAKNPIVVAGSTLLICSGMLELISAGTFSGAFRLSIEILIVFEFVAGACLLIAGLLEDKKDRKNGAVSSLPPGH